MEIQTVKVKKKPDDESTEDTLVVVLPAGSVLRAGDVSNGTLDQTKRTEIWSPCPESAVGIVLGENRETTRWARPLVLPEDFLN